MRYLDPVHAASELVRVKDHELVSDAEIVRLAMLVGEIDFVIRDIVIE